MPDENKPRKSNITATQSVLIGSLTGFVETCITHPLWTIKTKIQQGSPINYHPKHLFKGFTTNAAGFMPTTAVQLGTNYWIKKHFYSEQPTYIQSINASFAAGVASSLVSCPVERVMTLQGQAVNHYFAAVTSQQFKQHGISSFFSGQTATALREGGFSVFFISITPELKKEILPYCINDTIASLISGTISGIGATLISQPADTIKTIQQSSHHKNIGFFKTAKNIYNHKGCSGFFSGTAARSSNIIVSVTLMSWMQEQLEKKCENQGSDLSP